MSASVITPSAALITPPLFISGVIAIINCSSSGLIISSLSSGIGSPPILPLFSICCKPILACIRKSSKNFTPKKRTTSAGTTYSPSLNIAGMSSLTSSAREPEGISLPLTGSRFMPSSLRPPPSCMKAISVCLPSID